VSVACRINVYVAIHVENGPVILYAILYEWPA